MRVGRRRAPLAPAIAAAGPVAATVLTGAAVLLLASACTNSESAVQKNPHAGISTAASTAGTQQVVLKAGPDLRFHPSTIVVHPGKVRVVLENTAHVGQGAPHNFQVSKDPDADLPLTTAGQQSSTTFIAPAPGRYRFVCTLHAAQGQTGTLVVTRAAK
jgi:plastocyanin